MADPAAQLQQQQQQFYQLLGTLLATDNDTRTQAEVIMRRLRRNHVLGSRSRPSAMRVVSSDRSLFNSIYIIFVVYANVTRRSFHASTWEPRHVGGDTPRTTQPTILD